MFKDESQPRDHDPGRNLNHGRYSTGHRGDPENLSVVLSEPLDSGSGSHSSDPTHWRPPNTEMMPAGPTSSEFSQPQSLGSFFQRSNNVTVRGGEFNSSQHHQTLLTINIASGGRDSVEASVIPVRETGSEEKRDPPRFVGISTGTSPIEKGSTLPTERSSDNKSYSDHMNGTPGSGHSRGAIFLKPYNLDAKHAQDTQTLLQTEKGGRAQRRQSSYRPTWWFICAALLPFIPILIAEPSFLVTRKFLEDLVSKAVSQTEAPEIMCPSNPERSKECQPPSANIFARSPPRLTHSGIIKSVSEIDKFLSERASKPDVDSIAVAIVTPAGTLLQGGYGVLRANETGDKEKGTVDEDSIYRIAGISKIFTVLETLILRERGALSWDDPIDRYVADITLPPESYGWANYMDGINNDNSKARITLRDLVSHLGGIGRDYPPVNLGEWPSQENQDPVSVQSAQEPPSDPPPTSRYQPRELVDILYAVSVYPLVTPPQTYPVYSNTGINLLGQANIRANALSHATPSSSQNAASDKQPTTHKDLLHRDIFAPLQMNSTFFRLPASPHLRSHIAVPSSTQTSYWADISLGDAEDPSAGQYSSLSDLARFMKTLLDPTGRGGVIPPRVVREWLRPVFVWGETNHKVGLPWEVMELNGVTTFTQGGKTPGYHSKFAVLPEYSLGIILLITGNYSDTSTILGEVSKRILPTLSNLHNVELKRRYVGTWANIMHMEDVAEIAIDEAKGAIYLTKLVVRGVDVVKRVYELGGSTSKPKSAVFLWPTGRPDEFRIAFGRPVLNDQKDAGCFPYWLSLHPGISSRGAPLDVVYWKAGVLYYPSAGVEFTRQEPDSNSTYLPVILDSKFIPSK